MMKLEQKESEYTLAEMQTAAVREVLNRGFMGLLAGEILAKWLSARVDKVKSIFAGSDEVYIRLNDKDTTKELAKLVIENDIGDEKGWVKFKDDDGWYLWIWWD